MDDKDCVSLLWCELTERLSRLSVMKAATFFQLGSLSADGLIKQVVLKQVKMESHDQDPVAPANVSRCVWIKTKTS